MQINFFRFLKLQYVQKFIIYCRSSPLIHNLPTDYPLSQDKSTDFHQTKLSSISDLFVLKLNAIHSQQSFNSKIRLFFDSDCFSVLIIIINITESSTEAINHLRMIIEETEPLHLEMEKSIVLLLHFPSSMFSGGIYPTLFSDGWKYRYIDSLESNAEAGAIDIELWIKKCVEGSDTFENSLVASNYLLNSMKHVHTELMADFNSNFITRNGIEQVLEKTVAKLCAKFMEYFDIKLFNIYFSDAVQATYKRGLTISMKSYIDERIKDNFFYFLKYVISYFHIQGVTSALLKDTSDEFIQNLIPYIPVPGVIQLTNGTSYFPQSMLEIDCNYRCPFFREIYDDVNAIIYRIVHIFQLNGKKLVKGDLYHSMIEELKKMMQVCKS